MNLHSIAASVIGAVNPMTSVTVKQSTGYTTQADGTQQPQYATASGVAQRQALSASDIQHLDNLNIQGVECSLYISGNLRGLVRPLGTGGDIVLIGGQTWLVAHVFEAWPDWCRVGLCLQR